jgi:hypothetical protein
MKFVNSFLLACSFISIIQFSCPRDAHSATVYVSGATDQKMYNDIKNMGKNIDTIEINSFGGSEKTAIEIANIVKNRNLIVKVKNYCLSSCAMYILAGASRVIVSDNAIVGFHVPAIGTYEILKRAAPNSAFTAEIGDISRNSIQLYRSAGKNISVLKEAFIQSNIYCVSLYRTNGEVTGASSSYNVDVWVPGRAYLISQGWKIDGYWPDNQQDVNELSRRYLVPQAIVRVGNQTPLERPVITISETGCPSRQAGLQDR